MVAHEENSALLQIGRAKATVAHDSLTVGCSPNSAILRRLTANTICAEETGRADHSKIVGPYN